MLTDDGHQETNTEELVKSKKLAEENEKMVKGKDANTVKVCQAERSHNERLKKDIHVTTMEKNEEMAKKRHLEGNSKKSRSC